MRRMHLQQMSGLNAWNIIFGMIEAFSMLLALVLLFLCSYELGRYRVFENPPPLSEICPSLYDLEEEPEDYKAWRRMRQLFLKPLKE